MIKATGKKDGEEMTVEYVNGHFLFNGKEDVYYDEEIEYEMSMTHAIGGTFFPQKHDLLNVVNVLREYFFDAPADIETDEEIPEIPDDGRVY